VSNRRPFRFQAQRHLAGPDSIPLTRAESSPGDPLSMPAVLLVARVVLMVLPRTGWGDYVAPAAAVTSSGRRRAQRPAPSSWRSCAKPWWITVRGAPRWSSRWPGVTQDSDLLRLDSTAIVRSELAENRCHPLLAGDSLWTCPNQRRRVSVRLVGG
jgi:hypothetical protein